MGVKTYDPTQNSITFGGVPITGFADGTFINIERDEDTFTKVTGADGTVSRSKTSNKSARVTITLLQTSGSNDYFSGVHIADELSNLGVLPFLMKDLSGNTVFFAAEAWLVKPANIEQSKEITEREWMLDTGASDFFVGGNNDAS